MEKKNIILIAGLFIVLLLLAVIVFDKRQADIRSVSLTDDSALAIEEEQPINLMTRDSFRSEVPVDIKVPELNEPLSENQKKEIAVPEVVVPAAPGADTKLRSFNISAADNKFTPTKIIANLNDIVHISFTALDKDYSLYFPSYRMSQSAKQGETKILEFQASKSGDFLYYCPTCGGPENGPTGHIIIVE